LQLPIARVLSGAQFVLGGLVANGFGVIERLKEQLLEFVGVFGVSDPLQPLS
jgi:hypothetical protein